MQVGTKVYASYTNNPRLEFLVFLYILTFGLAGVYFRNWYLPFTDEESNDKLLWVPKIDLRLSSSNFCNYQGRNHQGEDKT